MKKESSDIPAIMFHLRWFQNNWPLCRVEGMQDLLSPRVVKSAKPIRSPYLKPQLAQSMHWPKLITKNADQSCRSSVLLLLG